MKIQKTLLSHTANSSLLFSKMHAAGNDFVIIDLRKFPHPSPKLCSNLADRHKGIGCDLILGIDHPLNDGSHASYRIWTSDGLTSKQCGNGARCIAKWLYTKDKLQTTSIILDSPSGTHGIERITPNYFRMSMGNPNFSTHDFPLKQSDVQSNRLVLSDDTGELIEATAVSIGNPHIILEVEDITNAPVSKLGPLLQACESLPAMVNVNFAQIISRGKIKLRVFEFGAGETMACASGASAAAAVFMKDNRVDDHAIISMVGGDLKVRWLDKNKQIEIEGPATSVFEGEYHHAAV